MSKPIAEAILNQLVKLSDYTGRVMSFAEGQTIVPNTLLTQVWEEAQRQERERIIELMDNLDCDVNGKEHDCNPLDNYTIQDLIALIKGEQK